MVHRAGKAVGRKPFRKRVRFEERAIDFLWAGCQNAVQAYGIGHPITSMNSRVIAQGRTRLGPTRHGVSDFSESAGSGSTAASVGRNGESYCGTTRPIVSGNGIRLARALPASHPVTKRRNTLRYCALRAYSFFTPSVL